MKTWVSLVTAVLLLIMGLVAAAPAEEVVGHLTQVEGQVDLLKGGQLPANPAKLQDPVALGDVIRTKSLSKANITFVDNTVITVSPESRIAIEDYMFDPAKGKRSAVLQLFQGMALAVVSKIFKTEQPDFVIKTHTAIMGVRGTEVGVRLSPNDSTFLNFEGLTRVANLFPEVSGDLFRKAAKVAFSFGKGYVDLGNMQATTVTRGLPPTLPYSISKEDREMFMRQMVVSALTSRGVCTPASTTCNPYTASSSESSSNAANTASNSSGGGPNSNSIIIVQALTTTPVATLVNLTFSQMLLNIPATISTSSLTSPTATFNLGSSNGTFSGTFAPGSGTMSIPSSLTLATTSFLATITANSVPGSFWNNGLQLTLNPFTLASAPTTVTGTLSGQSNGPLSGTLTMTLSTLGSRPQTFTLQGTASLANSTLTFSNLSGTFITSGGLPSGTLSSAVWTQLATQVTAPAISTAASAAGPQLTRTTLAGTGTGYQRVTPLVR